MLSEMSPQTMKRLVSLQFKGIKSSELEMIINEETRVVFECQKTSRKFEFRGPKEIEEIE